MLRSCQREIIKSITSQVIKTILSISLTVQQSSIATQHHPDSFSALLKQWRHQRGFSQLDLAVTSQVSQRHISFLESGRAQPSRDMVLQLADVLEIPLRQQNLMLSAAGFAPIHAETDLSAPEMAAIRRAIDFMLQQQEPYPGIVVDRYWNLLLANNAANRLLATFITLTELETRFSQNGKINLMRVVFDPQGLRPFIVGWEKLAAHLLQRVHREAMAEGENEQSNQLLHQLLGYPGVAEIWRTSDRSPQNALLLTTHFRRDRLELQFFSTLATLGTPYDITLQELRIESFFPADETSDRTWKALANR
ncbi:MAG: helix-turn-helix domain-containing protein [Cyanosarcina radialis HA8281-LM2]|jgi:transcriptional regulator with XRE-family HTH domain|nr:helix-turn-helix domain-containing protein [Cyanosarcina radialis HA8281-LM2]